MNRISKYSCQGITLLEVPIILGLLFILVSFALPEFGGATVRADMRAANENLQYSIQNARNTARMAESIVSMNLLEEPGDAGQRITFSAPETARKSTAHLDIQDYQFNAEIKLVSDYPSYEFDSRGIVKNPGKITLVSTADESVIFQIMVE